MCIKLNYSIPQNAILRKIMRPIPQRDAKRIRNTRAPSLKNFDAQIYSIFPKMTRAAEWLVDAVNEIESQDLARQNARLKLQREMHAQAAMDFIAYQIQEMHDMTMELDKITAKVSEKRARELSAFLEKCYGHVK